MKKIRVQEYNVEKNRWSNTGENMKVEMFFKI